jgi:hypothetical protein
MPVFQYQDLTAPPIFPLLPGSATGDVAPVQESLIIDRRATIYQAMAYCPMLILGVSVAGWMGALSEPVRAAPRDVFYQAQTVQPVLPAASDVTGIKYLPWSEPIRVTARTPWYQDSSALLFLQPPGPATSIVQNVVNVSILDERGIIYPAHVDAISFISPIAVSQWYEPWSEPIRTAPRDAWFQPDTIGRPASDVTGIKYSPLSEPPVRVALRDAWYQPTALGLPPPDPAAIKYQPWSEPVRSLPRAAQYQDYTANIFPLPQVTIPGLAADIVSIGASDGRALLYQSIASPVFTPAAVPTIKYQPWSEPVRTAARDAWYQADTFGRAVSDVTGIKYLPWSEPIRTAARTAWYQPDTLGRPASDVTGIKFAPLSEPVRTAARDAWYQDYPSFVFPPAVPVVSYPALAEPVRISAFLQSGFLASIQAQQAVALPTAFFAPLAEPVRIALRTVEYPSFTIGQPPAAETVTESRWHQPWSEPVRTALRDAWYQPDTIGRPASDVTGIKYSPLSEPVRSALRDAWFQPQTAANIFPLPQITVPPTAFFAPLAEPVRTAPRTVWFQPDATWPPSSLVTPIPGGIAPVINVSILDERGIIYPAYVIGQPPAAETVTESRWHQPWSEPVRTRALATAAQQAFVGVPFITTATVPWFAPLSEPVRTPARDAWYQDFAAENIFPLPNVVVPPTAWFAPWQDPVRTPPRTVWFDPSTRSLNPVVPFSYYNWLSEPVRTPPRLFAGNQPVLGFAPNPVVPFSYYNWLSEPVRFKPVVVWQQFTSLPTPFITPAPLSFQGWYSWLSEPVRLPVGLKAYLQSTTAMPVRLIAAFTSGNMHAVEIGDVFSAGGVTFNRVVSGEVGIIQKPTQSGEAGIVKKS